MKVSRNIRVYWVFSVIVSLVVVLLLFFTPLVYAQGANDFEDERLLRTFQQVFNFIRQNYVEEVDAGVLIEGAMKGMFESLDDPYSAYLDMDDMRSLTDTTSGEFGGVGLYINKVRPSDDQPELSEWVEIVSPIQGTPAFRAGLRPRDLIVEITGESTIDMSIDEVVGKLRGKPGTPIEVTILRNMKTRFIVMLDRAIIEIPTIRYGGIQDDIGYVRVIQFTPRTAEKAKESLEDLKSQGYRNMIIDLRTNPGGLLTAAIDTADLFFDDGLVVGTAGRTEVENRIYYAQQGVAVHRDAQVVVLINEGTASAAEILAGALKDRGKAVLVGTTSFGKGSVQQVRSIGEGGFRLTMAKYYTPNKTFINKIGIVPDVVIDESDISEEEDQALIVIQSEQRIQNFLGKVGTQPQEFHIRDFIADLRAEGLAINERLLRRLITVEVEALLNNISVFDLDYDLVLQEAVSILREGRAQAIIEDREPTVPVSSTLHSFSSLR